MKYPLQDRFKAVLKAFTVARLPGQELTGLGYTSRAGVHITEETAFNCVAFYACVRLLSETEASLPLFTFQRLQPRGKEKALSDPRYALLHDAPNPEMTSFTFRETLMAHLVTWGNAYALIDFEDRITPKALWPLRPDRITVTRDPQTRQIVYTYTPLNGVGMVKLPPYRVLHIPGLGFDGLVGYSPLGMVREAIGLSLATEEFGARFFGQGTNVGAVAMHPGKLTAQGSENLKKQLSDKYEGLGKSHRLMILEEGMTFEKTTIPPEDAQFLETRKFQRAEIASFFHIPPHMIGDLEKATYSNIEQQSLEFVVFTMRPWLVRWEQALNTRLFTPEEQKTIFVEHLVDGLLRGDFESRTRGYWQAIQGGWMSPNEIRELENKNPREGGDQYLQPVNMVVSGQSPSPASPKAG